MDLRHAQLVSQLDSARSEYEAAFRELQALFTAVSLVQLRLLGTFNDTDPAN